MNRLLGWIHESDPRHVVWVMCVCIAAMGAVGVALAILGAHSAGIVLGIVIIVAATLLALQTRQTVTNLGRQSASVRQAAAQAEQHYLTVLRQIVRIVEARDRYTRSHSDRVAALAEQIASRLKLPDDRCRQLRLAGQLHDVGLLAVPSAVLAKRGGFSTGEFEAVKKHSQVSFELLQPVESLADVLSAIRHHHERLNGTGYPDGLSGDDITLEARILAVADSYEAMTHDRPHRSAMTPIAAMRELRRCSPSGYDVRCVDALAVIIHLGDLQEIMSLADDDSDPADDPAATLASGAADLAPDPSAPAVTP